MFDRQWFSGQSQIGLFPDSLYYEKLLRARDAKMPIFPSKILDTQDKAIKRYWERQDFAVNI